MLAGFDRAHWHGIANSEIYATCQLLGIPSEEQPEVLIGVRIMVHAAKPVLNEKKHDE